VIGTSEHGSKIKDINFTKYANFKHGIIYFGGLLGLEGVLEEENSSLKNVRELFNEYINVCPSAGTEDI